MKRWFQTSSTHGPADQNKGLQTKLLKAAEKGASADVKKALESGANVVCFGEEGTPLHYASKKGNLVVASLLLQHGSPCNIMGDTNYAPLHLACRAGHSHIVDILIKHGAKVTLEAKFEKRSPLHLAAQAGHATLVKKLLNAGAKPEQTDLYGLTGLHAASRAGSLEVVHVLLDHGADPNMADKDGWTPLLLACERGHVEIVRLLLQHHAFIDVQNKYGRTPLHWACASHHMTVVELLLGQGANTAIKDRNGKLASECTRDPSILRLFQLQLHGQLEDPDELAVEAGIGRRLALQPSISFIGRTASTRRKASDTPQRKSVIDINPLGTFVEESDLLLDGSVGTVLGADTAQQAAETGARYKHLMNTVSGLILVMGGKTDALIESILKVLEGHSSLSYVDVLRELYSFLQTVNDSLLDFQGELSAEAKLVSQSFVGLLNDIAAKAQVLASDHTRRRRMRQLHFVSVCLADYPGSWRPLRLHLSKYRKSSDKEREFLDRIEQTHPREVDRVFEALVAWYMEEEPDNNLKEHLTSALRKCDRIDLSDGRLLADLDKAFKAEEELSIAVDEGVYSQSTVSHVSFMDDTGSDSTEA